MPDIKEIAKNLATQDNRMTDRPIFVVQQKKRIYWLDPAFVGEENIVWMHDGDEYARGTDKFRYYEKRYSEGHDIPSGWDRCAFQDEWVFVTACFTEQGCKDYIAVNGHNLKEPRIYAEGSYRNEEWRTVSQFLLDHNVKGEPCRD